MSRFLIQPESRALLERFGLTSAKAVFKVQSAQVFAFSDSSETICLTGDDPPTTPPRVFIKRYRPVRRRGLIGLLAGGALKKSKARLEFDMLKTMRARGIPVVTPLAWAERSGRETGTASALITEGVPDARQLDLFVIRGGGNWSMDDSTGLIEALARTVAACHRAGVLHGGMFGRNILIARPTPTDWTVTLLDPTRHTRMANRPVPPHAAAADLADLAATLDAVGWQNRTQALVRAYVQVRGFPGSEATGRSLLEAVTAGALDRRAQECHRVAVAVALDWFRRRAHSARTPASFRTTDEFLDAMVAAEPDPVAGARVKPGADDPSFDVAFEWLDVEPGDTDGAARLHLEPSGNRLVRSHGAHPDLTIRIDRQVWLAIVNCASNSLDTIRASKLHVVGDPLAMDALLRRVDGLRSPSDAP